MSDIIDHMEEVNTVASHYIMGKNETQIAKELDLPRTRVAAHLREWKSMAANSEAVRSRAREALSAADQHFGHLIAQAYEIIDEANTLQNLGAKNNALKLILDIEKSRIDILQKAGLLENKELAEQLLETERKQELIMGILKDIAAKHPQIRTELTMRLSEVAGPTDEAVVIYES